MPLKRESVLCDPEQMVGVRFVMLDTINPKKRVYCLVKYDALLDRASKDGNDQDWMKAWLQHRETIETLASKKYDAGKLRNDGWVIVMTRDLTPLGNKPTRW